ncbi:MAG TPA: DNA repair exonuclease [Kiloniellales bacterium]|nr:DNA repair exonuclease [Kiloniellales bacterium]
MIKILHTADVHLDSPLKSLALRDEELRSRVQTATRAAFSRIVDTALAEEAAALLIAGDLFDGAERSARTAAFLTAELDRLRARGIRVFYIKGNHDAENPISGELEMPDNVHVFDGRGGKAQLADDIWIHGVSFAGRQAMDSLLPKYPAPVAGAVNIGMLHTSLSGARGHDPYAPCSVSDLKAQGYDYWALGHVHRRQVHSESPWIVMPGTPQGRHIGEAGPKSASLVTIGQQIEVEEVPTSIIEFIQLELPVAADGDDELRDLIRASLHQLGDRMTSDFGILRLVLTGDAPRRWQILRDRDFWSETATRIARETDRLWLEKLVIDFSEGTTAGQGASDELAQIMATIRQEPGFTQLCRENLEELLEELSPQQRRLLVPDESSVATLAERLAAAGAERVLARMKGSGA